MVLIAGRGDASYRHYLLANLHYLKFAINCFIGATALWQNAFVSLTHNRRYQTSSLQYTHTGRCVESGQLGSCLT